MRIELTRDPADVDAAAQIWAEATAARDGSEEVAELADSRPIIQGVLDRSARSLLMLARTEAGGLAGFAAVEPAARPAPYPAADPAQLTAQLSYFGVSPRLWGEGTGERMLRALAERLAGAGYSRAELSVYVDNARATALYERLGWQPCGSPTPHPRTGKPEQRYQLVL